MSVGEFLETRRCADALELIAKELKRMNDREEKLTVEREKAEPPMSEQDIKRLAADLQAQRYDRWGRI